MKNNQNFNLSVINSFNFQHYENVKYADSIYWSDMGEISDKIQTETFP